MVVKAIEKPLITAVSSYLQSPCQLAVNPVMVEWNQCVAFRLQPLKGMEVGVVDSMAHPMHSGDLPPLLSATGRAYMAVLTDRFSIGQIIGKTVVVHSRADDFQSQPAGNAGEKIACGVIQPVLRSSTRM